MILALNNLQSLICHKTQPTSQSTKPFYQICFSDKDTPIEILTFFMTSGRFQEFIDGDGEHVETELYHKGAKGKGSKHFLIGLNNIAPKIIRGL